MHLHKETALRRGDWLVLLQEENLQPELPEHCTENPRVAAFGSHHLCWGELLEMQPSLRFSSSYKKGLTHSLVVTSHSFP